MIKIFRLLAICTIMYSLVQAAEIEGLYNTGVDDSGTTLPIGSLDPHYNLNGPSFPARVIDRLVGSGGNEWIEAPLGSAWIGPSSGFISDPTGLYIYSLSFDLSGMDSNSATISGSLAADNTPLIFLNGLDVGFSHPTQYFSLEPFVINSGFLPGLNTLEFRVSNNPTIGLNPTGLLITDIVGSASAAPLAFTPVAPCRIVDTRKTSVGIIGANSEHDFRVYGSVGGQGGNPSGCPSPGGEPLAAHLNMVAVDPTGKGNLQAYPVGAGPGAGLSVNYNTIDTNLANAGTVKTVVGSGPDITVTSRFSSAHTVIDVLGYYYPDDGFYYTPVTPCRIVDTRKTSAGIIDANTERDFRVFGSVVDQGGKSAGCPSTLGVSPKAAHLNMIAVDPEDKGNLQAFPVGAGPGAGLSVNYNTIDTNLANAGTVKTITGAGQDITVASNFSSAHTVIDVLGYYSEEEDLLYTPVSPCRIVDTRKTTAGIIDANTQRDFRVFGPVSVQGGNSSGCPAPMGEPLAAHINMIAVNPTSKGNLQAFPVGAGKGAGLSVNYNTIDTNLANAGTVKAVTGSGPDISVASNFSAAHTVIDVLGYYYPAP